MQGVALRRVKFHEWRKYLVAAIFFSILRENATWGNAGIGFESILAFGCVAASVNACRCKALRWEVYDWTGWMNGFVWGYTTTGRSAPVDTYYVRTCQPYMLFNFFHVMMLSILSIHVFQWDLDGCCYVLIISGHIDQLLSNNSTKQNLITRWCFIWNHTIIYEHAV